jgi:putative endonuclease
MGARLVAVNCLEKTLGWLDRKAQRRNPEMPAHLLVGMAGEDAAFCELLRKGYTVVARRWSASHQRGDLDLVAWNGPILCFIEVKTRTARDLSPAETAVDEHKRYVLRRLARAYLRNLPHPEIPPVRFDILSVYLEPRKPAVCVHFENAFGWSRHRRE